MKNDSEIIDLFWKQDENISRPQTLSFQLYERPENPGILLGTEAYDDFYAEDWYHDQSDLEKWKAVGGSFSIELLHES